MEITDKEIREELSKILNSYKRGNKFGYSLQEEVNILSWIEIAQRIGKLQAENNKLNN